MPIYDSMSGPHNPTAKIDCGLGCSHFARRYFENHCCFLFLGLLRCFSSPRSLYPTYIFSREWYGITRTGLPHSEISGFTVVCTYPKLIAAYHVLHRLSVPRHPPCALNNLTKNLLPISIGRLHEKSLRSLHHNIQLSKNSVNLLIYPFLGGDNRDRTGNLRLARATLSHLSYIPKE